ncbi:hypothetical protein PAPYR_2841 [Paratrimastix pyriformis]|uniref:Uncharacterized protein n=1 Tax=Paratrimastix pyriformis TaxID=342808 RepID=A0ABQ8URL7_9EUKA|nr:hypothetical protein PAPYR_2841 [Paratrimastix pyriformis]
MHLSFCEDPLRIQAEEKINHHLFFAPAFPGRLGEDDAITPQTRRISSVIARLPSGPGQVALKFRLPAEPAVVPTMLSEDHTVEELVYAPPHARFQFRPEGRATTPTHPQPAALPAPPSAQQPQQQPQSQPAAGPAPRIPEEIVKETFSGRRRLDIRRSRARASFAAARPCPERFLGFPDVDPRLRPTQCSAP